MAKIIIPTPAHAIGAHVRLAGVNPLENPMVSTIDNITSGNTAPALRMTAIKQALPEYFGRDAVADALALIERNQKYAPLCATLTGYAIERAQSGHAGNLAKFETFAQGTKHAQGAKLRALCAHVLGVKPAHLKSSAIEDYEAFAQGFELSLLALVAPKESAPRAKPTNWKAVAEQAISERDALAAELTELKIKHKGYADALRKYDQSALEKLTAKPAPVTA